MSTASKSTAPTASPEAAAPAESKASRWANKSFVLHALRTTVRAIVLILFTVDCVRLALLYFWVQGAVDVNFGRPQLSAGLSPLSGLFDLWTWVKTGQVDPALPASMVIVLMGLIMSVFAKRSFCSWMCPVGTLFDALGVVGRRIFPGVHVSPKVQRVIQAPKFVLGLFVIGFVLFLVPTSTILVAWNAPYWRVSDMAVLKLFIQPGAPIAVVGLVVLGLSLLLGRNYWCHGICPLGGIYGIASKASPLVVARDPKACINCKACSKACGAHIAVAESTSPLRTGDCTGCMECVAACPAEGALELRFFKKPVPLWMVPCAVLVIWIVVWVAAVALGVWYGTVTPEQIIMGMRTLG